MNRFCGGIGVGPAERLGRFGIGPNIFSEFAGDVGHGREDAASDHVALDLAKPDLHLVEPGGVRRGEMEANLRVLLAECLDGFGLVG